MAGGVLQEDGVNVADQTPLTRKSETPCWTISPNPTELYRGDTYQFVVCCVDGARRPAGTATFIESGETFSIMRFGDWSDPNPCTGFTVTVPEVATSFEIVTVCRNNLTGESCSNKITFACKSR